MNKDNKENIEMPIAGTAETEPPSKKSVRVQDEVHVNETYILIPPDGGWGWWVVFGAFVSYFIADGLQYSYGVFLNEMSHSLDCTSSQVALAGAISTCVFCVSGPFSAALVNRYGYRVISIVGVILASLACVLTSFSSNIYYVIGYHGVIGGVGFGMIYITALIAVGFYFERWRGLATSIAVCGSGMGGIVLPPILTIVMREIGWRHTFQCLSGATLSLVACSCLFRPLKPSKIILTTAKHTRSQESTKSNKSTKKVSYVSFLEKYQNKNFSTMMDQRSVSVYNDSSEQLFTTNYTTVESPNTPNFSGMRSAKSESLFSRNVMGKKRCCSCCCYKENIDRRIWKSRPIYRDDIFFTGSLATVPEYRSAQILPSRAHLDYQLSVTRMSTNQPPSRRNWLRRCCPNAVKRTLATMLDFRMMASFKFSMLILNAIFVSFGVYIPYMYIKDTAMHHGWTEDSSSWLISTIGITNTLGRMLCGVLSTSRKVSSSALCYTFLFVGGVATLVSQFSFLLWVQFLYCGIFGISMSSISALRTLIIVQMVGLENLTNAIGIILLFQGIASLCGLAVAGFLWDCTNDYKYSFYFGGGSLTVASIFLLVLHVKERKENKRNNLQTLPMTQRTGTHDNNR